MSYHLYVSNAGSEWLSHFVMDEQNGFLQQQEDIALGGSAWCNGNKYSGNVDGYCFAIKTTTC